MDVMIDPSGKPSEVLPIDCDPANFEVARKTLMKWRWTPPIGPSGTPTTAVSTIDLDFTRR